MFCNKCGTEIPDESKFCSKCGNVLNSTAIQPISNPPEPEGICCPKCKSKRLQVSVESNVNSTGGGYSGSKGCLGFFLLGPLGLLCGSCGSRQKITTANKTFWICQDCGNKFRNAQELMEEKYMSAKNLRIIGRFFVILGSILILSFIGLIIFAFAYFDGGFGYLSLDRILMLVVPPGLCLLNVGFGLWFIRSGVKAKREYEKLKAQYEKSQRKAKDE